MLWLLPGHLGNPLDLSLRALRVLGTAHRVFVEPGSERVMDALAERYGPGPSRVVPGSTDRGAVARRGGRDQVLRGRVLVLRHDGVHARRVHWQQCGSGAFVVWVHADERDPGGCAAP